MRAARSLSVEILQNLLELCLLFGYPLEVGPLLFTLIDSFHTASGRLCEHGTLLNGAISVRQEEPAANVIGISNERDCGPCVALVAVKRLVAFFADAVQFAQHYGRHN